MKILLAAINAKFIHSNLAVHSLRAYAEKWQAHTEISEYTINHLPEQIIADIYERRPDVIAFSCYIWNREMITGLIRELPKVLPGVSIWLGGPEATYDAPGLLSQYPSLSGIMVGEGEATFDELCRYYVTGEGRLQDIAGLCLPGSGYTQPRGLTRLDDIPFVYDDLEMFSDRILYYESSRGCPYRCSYCLSSIDKSVRFRSLDKVFRELDFFLDNRVPQVKFIDRTFNCSHEHCLAIWKHIKQHDNGVTNFHFEIAADLLTDEETALLRSLRPGLVQLETGVQTTNPDTLCAIQRRMSVDKLKHTVSELNENGNIHMHLDLIAGLPGEDMKSFRRSFDEVYLMGCDDLQLGFLKVLKGSMMHERAEEYGLRFLDAPPYEVLSTKWISYGDILELKRVERMLEMYHNSGQYEKTTAQLVKETGSPYRLFYELSLFYRQQGYEQNQPSRMERFRILLDFATDKHPENAGMYRELLTFDAYLRENCRTRPDFALDLMPWKEALRAAGVRREDHADVFFHAVWTENPEMNNSRPCLVVFDYLDRDPRTHNARVSVRGQL